jgi:hypothetical protein
MSVDCSRGTQADGTQIVCVGGDDNSGANIDTTVPSPPTQAPVILEAGCYQDLDVCPQAFALSWLVEHCTVSYVCPVRHYDAGPDERICLRFIEQECWDANSN